MPTRALTAGAAPATSFGLALAHKPKAPSTCTQEPLACANSQIRPTGSTEPVFTFPAWTTRGWLLRAGEAQLDMWGLKPGPARDFVRSRLSDFSLRCFEEAIKLPTNAAAKLPRTFIACRAAGYPARPVFQQFADRAKQEGWGYHELPTGHDCHVEMPDTFVSKLLAA